IVAGVGLIGHLVVVHHYPCLLVAGPRSQALSSTEKIVIAADSKEDASFFAREPFGRARPARFFARLLGSILGFARSAVVDRLIVEDPRDPTKPFHTGGKSPAAWDSAFFVVRLRRPLRFFVLRRERRSVGERTVHPIAQRSLVLEHRGGNSDVL